MTDNPVTIFLEDGQDPDDAIDAYLFEHPDHAGRDFFVIDLFSDDEEDAEE